MGQSGTSVKDQGSHDLVSEYGTQRVCLEILRDFQIYFCKIILILSSHIHLCLHLYFATKFLTAVHFYPFGVHVLLNKFLNITIYPLKRRSWLPCGLRRSSVVALLSRSRLRIPLEAWMLFPCVCLCVVQVAVYATS